MSTRYGSILLLIPALRLSTCGVPPTPRKLAQDAVAAMGGTEKLQDIRTLSTFADFVKAAAPPASSN